jgi:hypothetical protein
VRFLSHAEGKIFIMHEGRLKAKKGLGTKLWGPLPCTSRKTHGKQKQKAKQKIVQPKARRC